MQHTVLATGSRRCYLRGSKPHMACSLRTSTPLRLPSSSDRQSPKGRRSFRVTAVAAPELGTTVAGAEAVRLGPTFSDTMCDSRCWHRPLLLTTTDTLANPCFSEFTYACKDSDCSLVTILAYRPH